MQKIIVAIIVLIAICAGIGFYFLNKDSSDPHENEAVVTTTPSNGNNEVAENQGEPKDDQDTWVLGKSVDGRDITAYHYGEGDTELLFVGGIHGGYSWNTALVAYELMDYLEENPDAVPENIRVTVIPVLNPDGLEKVVGTAGKFSASDVDASSEEQLAARFNANDVDLNRNFDCDWQSSGTWQNRTVSGGDRAFSEPESEALRAYVEALDPDGVVVWYSAAGGVFSSSCHNGVSTETLALTTAYAHASGYKAYEEFDFYDITGDMVNWLAKENIPAISVLLTSHTDIEWNKNWKGIEALFAHFSE